MRPSVVVVGDSLLDTDVLGVVTRTVPDTDAPVLSERARCVRPGGAALAADLAARDGADVTFVTARGDDAAGREVRALLDPAVTVLALPAVGATGTKTRLLRDGGGGSRDHVVARHDTGGDRLVVQTVPAEVADVLAAADGVLVSDYGRGVANCPALRALLAGLDPRVPLVWDPHPRGPAPVTAPRLLVTPNADEVAAALGVTPTSDLDEVGRRAGRLAVLWGAAVVATAGARGAVLADPETGVQPFPTRPADHGDACGAGDRVASRLMTLLARGERTEDAVAAAVAAASGFVAVGGARALTPPPVRSPVVVATGGCFDLLHAGHLATLRAARALGDRLVVLLNSDDSVRRRKGADRPWQSAVDRARLLGELRCVDDVIVFDDDTPERVLRVLQPDVWVKGGDYTAADLPETPAVRSWGGSVVTVPYLPGRSSTRLRTLVAT